MERTNLARDGFPFPKSDRLLKSHEFDRVFAGRSSCSDNRLVVYALANVLSRTRLGLVVSKKVGNSVMRNRWKRTLREAFRLELACLPPGLDLVVLPRLQVDRQAPSLASLRESLRTLAQRSIRGSTRSR